MSAQENNVKLAKLHWEIKLRFQFSLLNYFVYLLLFQRTKKVYDPLNPDQSSVAVYIIKPHSHSFFDSASTLGLNVCVTCTESGH